MAKAFGENRWESQCRERLIRAGYSPSMGGWPDFVVYPKPGWEVPFFAVEAKASDSEQLNDEQRHVTRWLASNGIPVFKWSPDGGLERISGGVYSGHDDAWKYEKRLKLLEPEWSQKRDRLLSRADAKCARCGAEGGDVYVHPAFLTGDGDDPWHLPDSSLWCLCAGCKVPYYAALRAAMLKLASMEPGSLAPLED